jgi:hypothetical protein
MDTGVYSFFGYLVPKNVVAIEMQDDIFGEKTVRWRAINSPDIHSINLPQITEDNILAALAAMRLS